MKKVKGLEGKPHKEKLKSLGLFSLEESEGRTLSSSSFLRRGRGGTDTDLCSVLTQGNGLKCVRGGLAWTLDRGSSPRRTGALEGAPWNNGYGTEPGRAQEMFDSTLSTWCDPWGHAVQASSGAGVPQDHL